MVSEPHYKSTMATDDERIELLEKGVCGLQDQLQKLAVGMNERLQRLEESLKVISDVVLSSKTMPSPQLVPQELTNQDHYSYTDKGGAEGGHVTQKINIEKEPLFRFTVMGKKNLTYSSKKSRPYWEFVEIVNTRIDDIKDFLIGKEYVTATRGHRHPSKAKHEPQKLLNIEKEASFIVPGSSESLFKGLKHLNSDGCELLLIEASEDIEEELGLELKTEQEEELSSAADALCSDLLRTIGDDVVKYGIERPAPKPPDSYSLPIQTCY